MRKTFAVFANTIEELKEKNKNLFSKHSIFSDSSKAGSLVWIYPDLPKYPDAKTLSVSGIEYDHNLNQELPEIIGDLFDLNNTEIIGYKAGDCTVKSPKLEWCHFLRVQKFNETRHPKTKVNRVTVLAWTNNNYKAPVLLICKIK